MIIPVILAGGSGTRLWPLSRELYPKQFLRLIGQHSLLQETFLRLSDLSISTQPILICNEAHYFICLDQIQEAHLGEPQFILEPAGKNTAPAIAVAAFYALKKLHVDPVLLVMPSDHHIKNPAVFKEAIEFATEAAQEGQLVTFGIVPTAAKTGFGYIHAQKKSQHIFNVLSFTEKPNQETAEQFIKSEDYYWNSGIYLFKASEYLRELKNTAPDIYEQAELSLQQGDDSRGFLRLSADFKNCRSDSIDYAVMEKTKSAVLVPLSAGWSDLGCWSSVAEANDADPDNNVIVGNVVADQTRNCYLRAEEGMISAIGVSDHIVVKTKDSVLVAHKSQSQQLKDLVNRLKANKAHQEMISHHRKVHRPWGYYESLATGPNFQVKHIMVKSGGRLSLQLHQHRSEHWVVVQGTAEVTCDERQFTLKMGESTFVPKQSKHRLSNSGETELHVVEIQTGDYLGEDDIERFEDVYGRVAC